MAVFQTVLRAVVKILVPATEVAGLWFGHRVLLIDGSSFSMPDVAALQAYFGQPGNQAKGCGFPVAHILALFHAAPGCCWRFSRRRCGRMTWLAWAGFFPC